MKTEIGKWGNSLALRIPKAFAEEIHLEENTAVELSLDNGRLIIQPLGKPRYTLEELLAQVTPDNLHGETDTDEPQGKEVW